jgi:hypothetical protein
MPAPYPQDEADGECRDGNENSDRVKVNDTIHEE